MTSTSSDSLGRHDWHSAQYVEKWISSEVTDDEHRKPVLAELARTLAAQPGGPPSRVLDVGGGYGMLTLAVLEAVPGAHVVLQDFSEPMVAQARTRLSGAAPRVSYVLSDLRDPAWTEPVGGAFDAVVSSIAIHNVRDSLVIRRVYRDIHGLLRPGGAFYNLDFVAPAGSRTAAALGLSNHRPVEFGKVEPDMAILDGKVSIVTGAGHGVGRGHALDLAREGAKVVVNDVGGSERGEGVEKSAADVVVGVIRARGGEAVGDYEDVSDFAGAERMVHRAIETYGGLDVLVLNAGILRDKMIFNMDESDWDAVIRVHFKGHFAPARHACAVLARREPKSKRPGECLGGLHQLGGGCTATSDKPTMRRPRVVSQCSQSLWRWRWNATACASTASHPLERLGWWRLFRVARNGSSSQTSIRNGRRGTPVTLGRRRSGSLPTCRGR